MGRVAGRTADFLVRRDGTRVAGVSLIENSLTRVPGIAQMQIVQNSREALSVRIVPEPGFGREAEAELIWYFRETFPGIAVHLERVTELRREKNGKYRFAICEIA